MIEKLKPTITGFDEKPKMPNAYEYLDKINEIIEAINPILEERESGIKVYEEAHDVFNNATDEEPRCPFCGEELSYADEIDGGFVMLTCDCPAGIWLFGNDKIWHTISKLKKQLETKKD